MVSFDAAGALKNARTAAQLSQSDLAARAGLSRMTVQKIEAGAIDPRLSTLLVLMRALGLDLLLVPTAIRPTVDDFLRSGGRVVGQPAGTTAPASIVDVITPTWFQNLLAEGHNRERLARDRGCSTDDEFELLAASGRDLAGAVEVEPLAQDETIPDDTTSERLEGHEPPSGNHRAIRPELLRDAPTARGDERLETLL